METGHHIYYSSDIEDLTVQFSDILIKKPTSLFEKEIVLIPGVGMQSYLSLATARSCGICAGVHFWVPAHFLKELFSLDLSVPFPFDRKRVTWLLWSFLEKNKANKKLLPLFVREKIYRKQNESYIYSFANTLACVLEQYLLYAPDWLRSWQRGELVESLKEEEQQEWQLFFWKAFLKSYPEFDINNSLYNFFSYEKNRKEEDGDRYLQLPQRIFVFTIVSLPPLVENLLFHLASKKEIHWFFLESEQSIALPKQKDVHSLLLSYGKTDPLFLKPISRLYFYSDALGEDKKKEQNIHSITHVKKSDISEKEDTLLLLLQKSLHENKSDSEALYRNNEIDFSKDDSISIHSCHSPLREVEILRDWLLAQLEKKESLREESLRLEDILVMSPQPTIYAPFVEAVFGSSNIEKGYPKLGYKLLNNFSQTNQSFTNIFFQLMGLGESRFLSPDIFSIISDPLVAHKAKLSLQQIDLIRSWLQTADIRWGIDDEHSSHYELSNGLKNQKSNHFSYGLLRLFLSYAISPSSPTEERLSMAKSWNGLLPITEIEGEAAQTLGLFAFLFSRLAFYADKLRGKHSLSYWSALLSEMEKEILGTEKMLGTLAGLSVLEKEDGFDFPVSIEPIRLYLENYQIDHQEQFNRVGEGISFSAFLPMRSVPFSIICLLGMNESDFPRREAVQEFDLLSATKNKGLRAKEDRRFFLEVLYSTRSNLYVSYVGQSLYKVSESYLPSIVIQELLEYIKNSCLNHSNLILDAIFYKHYGHNFHRNYFKEKKEGNAFPFSKQLYNYSYENYKAALALEKYSENPPMHSKPFYISSNEDAKKHIKTLLEGKKNISTRIELNDFIDFFMNSSSVWLKKNLDFYIPSSLKKNILEGEENFEVDALQKYKIREILFTKMLLEEEIDKEKTLWDIQTYQSLPHGNYGTLLLEKIWEEAQTFVESIQKYSFGKLKILSENITIKINDDILLTGNIEAWHASHDGKETLVYIRSGKEIKPKDIMRTWILHLIWECLMLKKEKTNGMASYFIIGSDCIHYTMNDQDHKKDFAFAYLKEMIQLYEKGIQRPALYFIQTSYAYAASEAKNHNEQKALSSAKKKWENEWGVISGEKKDSNIELLFRGRDPFLKENLKLVREFQKLSHQIFQAPLFYLKKYNEA